MRVIEKRQGIQKQAVHVMGKRCEISIVTEDKEWAKNVIESAVLELRRIERLLTFFNGNSQAYQINRYAGEKPVRVDKEIFHLLNRSIKLSHVTAGAFDITRVLPENRLWYADWTNASPSSEKQFPKIHGDYRQIELDKTAMTVFLKEKGMRIGFGDFGRGYAADRARLVLEENGIRGGVINVGGNLTTWGNHPDGDAWTIYKADPNSGHHPFSYYNISNLAVATAITNKGQSVSISEPGGNMAALRRVRIICAGAETANALAGAISGEKRESGFNLINGFKNIACVITVE